MLPVCASIKKHWQGCLCPNKKIRALIENQRASEHTSGKRRPYFGRRTVSITWITPLD
jgi:hypothetical protein